MKQSIFQADNAKNHPINDTPPQALSDSCGTKSSASSNEEECSSPDSIKTELMLFKPISREPRTNSVNSKLVRLPSVRSVSSTSSVVHSPCPSPFFIPIAPRQSAFSFVNQIRVQSIKSPKTKNKRKSTLVQSPEKKSDGISQKVQKKAASVVIPLNAKKQTRKSATVQDIMEKETQNMRETRSRKRNLNVSNEATEMVKASKMIKSSTVPPKDNTLRRITRSMN